jgi:hypothetical protein
VQANKKKSFPQSFIFFSKSTFFNHLHSPPKNGQQKLSSKMITLVGFVRFSPPAGGSVTAQATAFGIFIDC